MRLYDLTNCYLISDIMYHEIPRNIYNLELKAGKGISNVVPNRRGGGVKNNCPGRN